MAEHHIIPRLSGAEIQAKVRELAAKVASETRGADLLLIGVLEGARRFAEDLSAQLPGSGLDWIRVASYKGTSSTGRIAEIAAPRQAIRGRHCLLVEDIVDTGRTLERLVKRLAPEGPASLRSCALLDKPSRRVVDIRADYVGFTIPDVFVVGYGLDMDHKYRNLPHIGYIDERELRGFHTLPDR